MAIAPYSKYTVHDEPELDDDEPPNKEDKPSPPKSPPVNEENSPVTDEKPLSIVSKKPILYNL